MKISLLFLTLETVDFESEHFFESHGQLQSAADLMQALTRFLNEPNWAKFGPSLGQIGPKQPIYKVETQDLNS